MTNEISTIDKKPAIFPLCSPNFHWDTLLRDASRLTGQRFNSKIDEHAIKPQQDQSVVAALSEFYRYDTLDPYYEIRRANSILEHLHFAFLCEYDINTFLRLLTHSNIKGTPHHVNGNLWIISGTLLQWKKAIVDCSCKEQPFDLRLLMNCLYVLFQCNGYQTVWDGYARTQHADSTFSFGAK